MEENENSGENDVQELEQIADEIVKLTKEVKEIKNNVKTSQIQEPSRKVRGARKQRPIDLNPAVEYIDEMLKNSSENIISELKAEFFRLFNFLSSLQSVSPYQVNGKQLDMEKLKGDGGLLESTELSDLQDTIEKEKEMLKLLLEERESLIYELTDQIVSIEAEKKILQEKLDVNMIEKEKWIKQREVLEKLVTSDPRFNIINLLRRMGVIAPIQLSFVLGVSLSQTKRYIFELEKMNILITNEDETISLHPNFDEETMNIKIDNNQDKK